jgi:tRNA modification GTPase
VEVDTIVAVSTPPGAGAVAVVRLSGPAALDVLRQVAPSLPRSPAPRSSHLARIVEPATGAEVDRALVTFFAGPASYTGEDVVEISGHGGWLAPSLVVNACVQAGARRAEAGEFTRRAYLNGKLDLVQAEAVLDLVESRSPALHRAALRHLERGLSDRISELRSRLVHLEALLAHHIDFPEEDDAPVPRERILEEARDVLASLALLLETAPEGELLREGALAVLAGRPNAGKSSLFNALIGEERAIVTEHPGTTRDAIEAVVSLGGFPFRLVDTAGLRDDPEPVERIGIDVARRFLERADLVLLCVDAVGGDGVESRFLEEVGERPVVVVRTKADLAIAPEGGAEDPALSAAAAGDVQVSVVTGQGLGALRKLLPALVYEGLVRASSDVPVLTRARHTAAVRQAFEEVAAFVSAVEAGVPAELAATHVRPAESALEELLGVISPDEILDRLFGEFCIGK